MAAALCLHASTVRRVVANTYLATAHGVVPLTSFLQSGLESAGGETRSSLTVKDRITQLVAAEDTAQPLTDQQLVEALAVEQITIARRTVTQGGAYVNNRRVDDVERKLTSADLASETVVVLRSGKKKYALLRFA